MKKHIFGAWAALLALAFSLALAFLWDLAALAAAAEEAASQESQATRQQLRSTFLAQYEKRDYDECKRLLAEMQTRFPTMKSVARFEFMLGRDSVLSRGGDRTEGGARLEKFLPSGANAQSAAAQKARCAYAEALAEQGKFDEAKPLLEGVLASEDSRLIQRAFHRADAWGLVETAEDAARWTQGLNAAVAQAEQRLQRGQAWVQEAQKPAERQKRNALLQSDAENLPALRGDLRLLAERAGAGSSGFEAARRQALAKEKAATSLPRNSMPDQVRQAWTQVETLRSQALAELPPLEDVGASESLDPNQLKARVTLGVAKFQAGKTAEGAALMQQAAAFGADPRCQDDAVAHNAIIEARLWLVAWRQMEQAPAAEIDQTLLDLVENNDLTPGQLAWVFRRLACLAGVSGRAQEEYLYLRDLKDFLPVRRETFQTARQMKALAQAHPQLETASAGAHSPGYQRMAAKGRLTADSEGKTVFKTIRPQ